MTAISRNSGGIAAGMVTTEAYEATLALLAARASQTTVCPSEVARLLSTSQGAPNGNWRDKMPEVHAAVDRLLADGLIRISWKGRALDVRSGPYRISRAG